MNKKPTKINLTSDDSLFEKSLDLQKYIEELSSKTVNVSDKFSFTWAGKSNAIKSVLIPSKLTLDPKPNESIKWDESENLFIEGDNLEVLKLLQKAYFEKVKMIYIDPPYNTGHDFVYNDNFSAPLDNYLKQTGQKTETGESVTTNKETNGRYHSNWLSMMYPRLKLAWNLLREDGVIFVSIDDNEYHHLRMLLDEVFGEDNFRNCLTVRRRVKSLNIQFADKGLKTMNVGFEYVLIYSKTEKFLFPDLRTEKEDIPEKGSWNVFWSNADRPTMRYEILGFTPDSGQWRWSKEKAEEGVKNYENYLSNFSKNMTLEDYWRETGESLKFIRRIEDGTGKNGGVQCWVPPSTSTLRTTDWTDIEVSEIHKEIDLPFDNPKSVKLIRALISTIVDKDALVLDFFAGSGTTAHAILKQNEEDGGTRKFICIQLPEKLENQAQGYKTIADITKARIRTVINGYGNKPQPINAGFKVFTLSESNYPENNFEFNPGKSQDENKDAFIAYLNKEKQSQLFDKENDTSVVYENIVKEGLSLNSKVEAVTLGKNKVYKVTDGDQQLLICLENKLASETVKELTDKSHKDKLFICLESALDDTTAANLSLNLDLKTI